MGLEVGHKKGGGPSWPGNDPALRHGSGALSLRGVVGPNPWVRCGEYFSLRQGQCPLPILLILVSPLTVPAVSCCCRRLPPFFSAMPSCIDRASCAEWSLTVRGSAHPRHWAKIHTGFGILAERAAAFLAARKQPGLCPEIRLFTVRFLKTAPCARRANPTTRVGKSSAGASCAGILSAIRSLGFLARWASCPVRPSTGASCAPGRWLNRRNRRKFRRNFRFLL